MTKTTNRLVTTVAAVVAAGVTFAVLDSAAGIDLAARTGTTVQHVTLAAAVLAAAVSAAAGWGLLALLERFTTKARAVWTAIAAAALLLSLLVGPTAGVTTAAKLGLAALHLVVGAVVIVGLRRSTR
jgi:hypothetical protein